MRTAFILLSLAAALAARPAIALNENLPPVGCIVSHTDRIKAADLTELVKSGFAPTTKSGKVTMMVVGQVVQGCRRTYGWGQARENAALQFFRMRVLRDDAIEQGKQFGLTEEITTSYLAGLTPELRAIYATGKVTPDMNQAAFAHLQHAGIKLEGLNNEQVQALGQAVNVAIYAAVGQAEAERAYAGK